MFTSNQKEPLSIPTNIRRSAKVVKRFGDFTEKKSVDTIGSRLKAFAKARYKRLGVFAEAAGINPSQLSDYVADKFVPRGDVLTKFAELGLNVNWLLTGEGEMFAASADDDAPADVLPGITQEDLETFARVAKRLPKIWEADELDDLGKMLRRKLNEKKKRDGEGETP